MKLHLTAEPILFDVNNEKSQRIDDIMRRIYTALPYCERDLKTPERR